MSLINEIEYGLEFECIKNSSTKHFSEYFPFLIILTLIVHIHWHLQQRTITYISDRLAEVGIY